MKKILLSALVFVASTFAAHAVEGELSGKFIINTDGDSVHFSRGNLQYDATTQKWSFAASQYMEGAGLTYFCWGTSGWNSGANEYQPYSISTEPSDYFVGGSAENDLTGDYAYADWGIYNPIENGGNRAGLWRVLTHDEWIYLFELRPDAGKLFAYATINNGDAYKGVVLLPDNWVLPEGAHFKPSTECYLDYEAGSGYRNMNLDMNTNYNDNVYTSEQWAVMDAAGAVFFPACGYAKGTEVFAKNTSGRYASSTARNAYTAYALTFDNKELFASDGGASRGHGISVRLVTNEGAGQGIDEISSSLQGGDRGRLILRGGQVLILMDGKQLNILGAEVK